MEKNKEILNNLCQETPQLLYLLNDNFFEIYKDYINIEEDKIPSLFRSIRHMKTVNDQISCLSFLKPSLKTFKKLQTMISIFY